MLPDEATYVCDRLPVLAEPAGGGVDWRGIRSSLTYGKGGCLCRVRRSAAGHDVRFDLQIASLQIRP